MTEQAAPPRPSLPAPPAARLRRPGWRDPRLLVGLVLVAASVALGSWVVSDARRPTPVWAARGTLTPGTPLTAEHLVAVEPRLEGELLGRYLDAREALPAGLVLSRVVEAGEIVPRGALVESESLGLHPVPVPVADPGSSVVPGGEVELWHVPAEGEPYRVVERLTVKELTRPEGAFASGESVVHVLVPEDELAAVLAVTSGEGTVRLVPVLGG